MANRYATKTGVWSDTTVWDGGTLPQPGDVVRPNNFNVTIDQDVNVAELRNNAGAPAVAGGQFFIASIPGGGRTITASLPPASFSMLVVNHTGPEVLTVNGAVLGGSSGGAHGIQIAAGTASLIVNGNVTGLSGVGSHGITVGGTGTVTVNGDLLGGASASTGSSAINVGGLATIIVNGNVTGGSAAGCRGINSAVAITINITGTVAGGILGAGLELSGAVAVSINGALIASNAAPAVRASNAAAVIRARGPFYHAANNRTPIVAESFMVYTGVNTRWEMKDDSASPAGGANVIMTNYVSDSPAPSDVRAGVAYGPTGTLIGTLDMPAPAAVASGVPVGNTTGTAALTQASVAEVVGPQLAAALHPVEAG